MLNAGAVAKILQRLPRSGKNPSSMPVSSTSSAISCEDRRISFATRPNVASKLDPASVQITMRSSMSGSALIRASRRFCVTFLMKSSGI